MTVSIAKLMIVGHQSVLG